uniref:Uncharacterized protein n=1 Tax=Anguilla anguilla TaxID=7936 RepID=A0A0E9QSN9_ANGAN
MDPLQKSLGLQISLQGAISTVCLLLSTLRPSICQHPGTQEGVKNISVVLFANGYL